MYLLLHFYFRCTLAIFTSEFVSQKESRIAKRRHSIFNESFLRQKAQELEVLFAGKKYAQLTASFMNVFE